MGIGETIKNVFTDHDEHTNSKVNTHNKTAVGHNRDLSDASGHSASSQEPLSPTDNSSYGGSKLPAGTGVGTSGHAATGADRGIASSGTAAAVASKLHGDRGTERVDGARTGDLHTHSHGHNKPTADVAHIPGQAEHDTNQLQHVTHENVRHVETEEVLRQKEHDRHVHHVKHHVQPVIDKEVRAEEHHDRVHPVTRVHETHATKDEDTRFLNDQVKQHHDTVQHGDKERTVVDKGTIVNENVHHHVHHVVQPVVEKETVDRHRIHTVIPIHETTHEAPVIHHSEAHAPVTMDAFKKSGGQLQNAEGHESIASKVLHTGSCERKVEGDGETLAEKLHLGGTHGHSQGIAAQKAGVSGQTGSKLV